MSFASTMVKWRFSEANTNATSGLHERFKKAARVGIYFYGRAPETEGNNNIGVPWVAPPQLLEQVSTSRAMVETCLMSPSLRDLPLVLDRLGHPGHRSSSCSWG